MPSLKQPDLKTVEQRVKSALAENGILVLFRVKNHKVDYSVMNRPEPTMTEINDHLFATALVDAVKRFGFSRTKRRTKLREQVERDDGRNVTYKESIDLDWDDETITATVGNDMMRKVMAIVVQNLMQAAMRAESAKGGLN
jgi:hypothetical protein